MLQGIISVIFISMCCGFFSKISPPPGFPKPTHLLANLHPRFRGNVTCKDNIKINLTEMGCRLNSSRSKHGDVAVMSLEGSQKAENFQAGWETIRFSRAQFHGISLF
jgi:hypothetical protein